MKKLLILIGLVGFIFINCKAQQVPVFKGTTYEEGGMYPDQIDTWSYKGFIFKTITPQIARPITTTSVYKKSTNGLNKIKNHELFGNNATKVSEIVNSKLKSDFQTQKKENPKCFKEFNPVDIDQMSISVDKSYMYFEMIWDTSFLTDASSECIYPSSIAQINLSEISRFIIAN